MSTTEERDRVVLELFEQVLEIEQRLIPTGLHIFGRVSDNAQLADLLRMVASFDRPECGTRALPDLVATGLGLPTYTTLLKESTTSNERLTARERVESLVNAAIKTLLLQGPDQAASLLRVQANVPTAESEKIFALLTRLREQLKVDTEMDSLMRALRGEYITPGPGADIVQNPDILPTGRNTHAVNPYAIPSAVALQKAKPVVEALLERHRCEQGHYPSALAMVLWGMDNIKTQGESVAQALWLLGVTPRRDSLNRATELDVVPLEQLGRPRIDVVMTVSGIFRDLFAPTMALLDQAVRQVAQLDEPYEMNFIKHHVEKQCREENCSFDTAVVRVFSNAAGIYGTNVNFMILDSQWEQDEAIADLFITRKCFAYGRGLAGREARTLMERALARVEATYQNIDTTEIGITDVDHYFEYLGGVTKAVQKRTGIRPQVYLSDTLTPGVKIRSLAEAVQLETRTKTLNPKWYEGMLKHGFRGVAEIEHHVSNTFGWSATADAVENWIYDEVAQTYLLDEEMLARLRSLNPHSTRNLVVRMLEAVGRGFWKADEQTLDRLHEIFHGLEDKLEGID
ncbi:MAG: cobaltochelatase subunit CobN [Acidobacteriota bacterium]